MHHLFPTSNSKRSDILHDIGDLALYALALLAVILMTTGTVLAQGGVAIGTGAPTAHASAALDVQSTTQGMLVPRMSTVQRTAIASPAAGLLVYDNTANQYYYHNGSAWQSITAAPGGSNWTTSGNSGTNVTSNYIGTADATGLSLRTNATERIRIGFDGRINFGTAQSGMSYDFSASESSTALMRITNLSSTGWSGLVAVGSDLNSNAGFGFGNINAPYLANVGYAGTNSFHPFVIYSNGAERMRFFPSGGISIGTNTEYFPFTVHGNYAGSTISEIRNLSNTGWSGSVMTSADGAGQATIGFGNPGASFLANIAYMGTNTIHPLALVTGSAERMRITATGNVGIGTTAPGFKLEVNGTAAKPGGGSWTASSDARLKQQVVPYTDGLSSLLRIKPVRFHYNATSKHDTSVEHVGVIAQDLKEVAPYMVGEFEMDGISYLNVDNSAMTYMLVNSVKEQQARIEEQAKVIEAQQQLIADMQRRLQQLEAR